MQGSYFASNIAIYDTNDYYLSKIGIGSLAYVHMQPAGAMRVQAINITIIDCYFFNNSNLKGIN